MFALKMWVATRGPLFRTSWKNDLRGAMGVMVTDAQTVGEQRIRTTAARHRRSGRYESSIHRGEMREMRGDSYAASANINDSGISGGGAIEAGRRRSGKRKGIRAFRNAARWLKSHSDEFRERAVSKLADKWNGN